ncbi:MAG: hypothetical protein SF029_12280 [bacterium]|nr:hypothetical protein [bacterium]
MVIETRRMTAEEFDIFAELPENNDKLLEFINGEIVEFRRARVHQCSALPSQAKSTSSTKIQTWVI